MSLRRQMLLAIANNYKWLPYSFEYLYHSLIPATINNKQVKDKTRLFKIEGNSEVVNQLIQNGDFNNGLDNWSFTNATASLSGKILTITASQSDSGGNIYWSGTKPSLVSGHRYLISFKAKSSSGSIGFRRLGGEYYNYTISSSTLTQYTLILTASSSGVFGIFPFGTIASINQGDQMELSIIKMTDLTQRYPFDTPTSLTDKRVQNIINRGSEDFNSGEIKNTSLGGFVSAPYNLLDLTQIEKGKKINTAGGIDNDVNSCYIKIKVVPRRIYTINFSNNSTTSMIVFYDKNGNFIRRAGNVPAQTKTIDLTASENINAEIIGITCWENKDFLDTACLHLASVDLGYKPHLNRLPTEYQEVEYIESTGTQLIETGFKANNNTRIVVDYEPNISYNGVVFWGSDGSSSGRFNFYYPANASYYRLGYGTQLNTDTLALSGSRTLCDWNKNVITINNQSYSFSSETFDISGSQIELFYSNGWSQVGSQGSMKLYSCKLYDNGNLIRNFIPCFRKSDNEIGLFDLVNQVFYTNNGTGTFLKGANVNSVSDLSFAYQGSGVGTSHDSVEKTATEWVFTKDRNRVHLYDLTWTNSNGYFYSNVLDNALRSENSQLLISISKYKQGTLSQVYADDLYYCVGYNAFREGSACIKDNSFNNDTTAFKNSLLNQYLEYQLATPQVIRIPLKHLRVVDMGTLSWTYISSENRFLASVSGIKQVSARTNDIYCEKYINDIGGFDMTKTGIIYHYLGGIYIQDKNYTNATDFTNAMKGQYLFYETQDEVPDFDLTMGSEAGGTLNSYDFKWIKNQLVENGNFASVSGWSLNSNTSYSVSNNVATIVNTSGANNGVYQNFTAVAGHKYLCFGKLKLDESSNNQVSLLVYANGIYQSKYVKGTDWNNIGLIVEAGSSGGTFVKINLANWENKNVYAKDINLIDLTKAQLDDATSINDPRIQRIIKLGYIPTDINGTLTYEETEVLPNVDVKEKAK